MKAASRLILRHEARVREADELRRTRSPREMSFPAHGRLSTGLQMPLSFAPYRLQAADRWWQQAAGDTDAPPRKRRG